MKPGNQAEVFVFFCNNFIYLFIYLFLAVLGLHCCVGFSVVAASGSYSVAVPRILIGGASLVEHRL